MSDLSDHLTLLSEPVRVRLLALLEREELGVGELTRILQLPQSTVSRHLKALRTAGWVHRRAEGTAGWFSMEAEPPNEAAGSLWAVVRDDHVRSTQHREDDARLLATIADRRMDSRTFFGRMHDQWSALRTQLFGDDLLLPTLLTLLPEGQVVADLGCGPGDALAALAPVTERAIGVDREAAMLQAAAERTAHLPNVDLREGGLEALPLSDAEVDVALCMLVLHHVRDLDASLREIGRCLRPGGRVVVLDMIAHDREDYRQTMGHEHLGFDRDGLAALARSAGLALRSWRVLPPAADAQGPPLFVAVLVSDS